MHIQVLRPPTFEPLQTERVNKPGFYHIVHFDGHGGYGDGQPLTDNTLTHQTGKVINDSMVFRFPTSQSASMDDQPIRVSDSKKPYVRCNTT